MKTAYALACLCLAAPTFAAPVSGDAKTVLAEGRAAIVPGAGGVPAAKAAAIALALRNAVERVTGTYVAATSLTRNYQLVKDEILTRADGFATLDAIIRTEETGGMVRVVIRATVSTRPLAERLKALRLTRAFPVHIVAPDTVDIADFAGGITNAGFVVKDTKRDAAILVRITVTPVNVASTALQTAAGDMTLFSVRSTVKVVATRAETGETIASLSVADTAAHVSRETAVTESTASALVTLLPRLSDALLVLPAQVSEPVQIVITGVSSATRYATLAEAITLHVPGVQSVSRRGYKNGRAVYEADVLTGAAMLLARALESAPGLKPFGLRVSDESRSRIVAKCGGFTLR